jgi:hypothetical protein
MAKDAIAPQELAEKFKTEKEQPYLRFVRQEGLDVISAQYVPNLRTVDLKPWPRRNGKGVFINHEASRTSNDCYV